MAKSKPAPPDDADPPRATRARRKRPAAKRATSRPPRARRVSQPRENPVGGTLTDDATHLGIGFGAYGGTRLLQRVAFTATGKRKPKWARHAHALAGILALGASYVASKKIGKLQPYHEAIVMGAGIAAAQGVVTAFVPKYGWIFNDCKISDIGQLTAGSQPQQPTGDDLERQVRAMELGTPVSFRPNPIRQTLEAAAAAAGDPGLEESLVEELGDEPIDDLYGGVFENPTLAAWAN